MDEKKNIHKGHRQKVRESYYKSGLDGEPDHRILEFLLFFGIPYKDTNVIAHELIEKFGSFSGVLKASVEELKGVKGMTENAACLISLILPVYKRYADDILSKKPVLTTTEEIVEFIRPKFIGAADEKIFLLCFDSNHSLLTVRLLSEGDISSASFDMRSLASAVLETKAQSAILVHNHPNGIALPSVDDVETTKTVYNFLQTIKVTLLNHIIISDVGHCSMIDFPKFAHIFYGLNPIA